MKEAITDEKNMERLTEEERIEYQRLKGIEDLAKALGKEVPEDVKKGLEEYEEKLAKAEKVKAYEDAQIAHRGEVEEFLENDVENVGELSQKKKEKLHGNREAIIKDLKEKYLKEKDTEMMGYKGKEVHFSLPAVGKFEGFKLDYFVSNDIVYKRDFESNPKLEKELKSMKQIGEILKAVNRYMAELGVETDGDIDYENNLQHWKTNKYRCKAGDCLKDILGLNKWYWTSDKDVDGGKDLRVRWYCNIDYCSFGRNAYDYANLFLKLSN